MLIEDAQSHFAELAERQLSSNVATPVAALAALARIVVVVPEGFDVVEGPSVRRLIESTFDLAQLVASHHEERVAHNEVQPASRELAWQRAALDVVVRLSE